MSTMTRTNTRRPSVIILGNLAACLLVTSLLTGGHVFGNDALPAWQVLRRFCELDNAGKLLARSPEIAGLLSAPMPTRYDEFYVAISYETFPFETRGTETVDWVKVPRCTAAHVDSQLRVMGMHGSLMTFYKLSRKSGRWLVEPPYVPYVGLTAGLRYLSDQAARNPDPKIRKNAAETIAYINKHRNLRRDTEGDCY